MLIIFLWNITALIDSHVTADEEEAWFVFDDDEIKKLNAKNALKKLNIDKCPCKLNRDYIHGVGYIN